MTAVGTISTFKRNALLPLALVLSLATFGTDASQIDARQGHGAAAGGRTLRVVSTHATPGTQVTVSIELDSQSDEIATSFTILFDQTKLGSPAILAGTGLPSGSTLTINPNQTGNGRLGLLMDANATFTASPPAREVVRVRFAVAAGAPFGPTPVTFGSGPTPLSTSSPFGDLLPTAYENGTVTIAQSIPGFQVSGRVTTLSGQGLRNAVVTMTDSAGAKRTGITSSFGFYSFDNVTGAQTYTLAVSSKRYRFTSRVLTVNDNLSSEDFAAQE